MWNEDTVNRETYRELQDHLFKKETKSSDVDILPLKWYIVNQILSDNTSQVRIWGVSFKQKKRS